MVRTTRARLGLLAAAAALLGLAACDAVPLLAPTDSTITISAAALTVPLNGTVQVSASVIEGPGTPVHDGTEVRFTTTLGTVDPPAAQTRGGIATATFQAGAASGIAQIRATSGAATGGSGDTAANLVEIAVGAAAADAVTLTATPGSVLSTGGTVTITATVLDVSGNGLPGLSVSFGTSAGTLSAVSAVTNAAGQASVTLTTTQEATVTATISSADAGTAEITVTVAIPGTVKLECSPVTASGNNADCTQTADKAVSFTAARGAVTTGEAAIVSSTLDFGDGSSVSLGTLSSSRTITHTYAAGSYTAVLSATDANGEQTQASAAVRVTPQPSLGVTLTFTPTTPLVNPNTAIKATVTPIGTSIKSYAWTISSGSTTERQVTTSGDTLGHVFTSTGIKTVTVVVTADDGRTATVESQVQVN